MLNKTHYFIALIHSLALCRVDRGRCCFSLLIADQIEIIRTNGIEKKSADEISSTTRNTIERKLSSLRRKFGWRLRFRFFSCCRSRFWIEVAIKMALHVLCMCSRYHTSIVHFTPSFIRCEAMRKKRRNIFRFFRSFFFLPLPSLAFALVPFWFRRWIRFFMFDKCNTETRDGNIFTLVRH